MEDRKLTGNKMFEMVKEECERSLGSLGIRGEKRKKGVLYRKKVNGKWGWNEFDDEKIEGTNRKYIGEYENMEPNGYGKFFCDVVLFCSNYEGEFKDGYRHGQGTETAKFGKFVGEFKYGKKIGQGTYTFNDGIKFVGEWKDGKEWNVIRYDKEGNIKGRYKNGSFRKHIPGTRYDKNGNIIGENKGKKKRKGVLFMGEVNGEIGWVENTDRSYGKYVGEIKNGEPNGQGKMITPDGEKVEGEWKDGVLHGKGTRTFPVGLKYVGEYKNGIRHGQGTQIHPYGWKYIGEWKDGRQHGQGTTTWSKGDLKGYRFVGEYNNGSFWSVTVYKDGNILYKYVNGVRQ